MTVQRDGSSLERVLDVAMERERLRLAEARRDKAQAELLEHHARLSHAHAALAQILSSNLARTRARRSFPSASRSGAPTRLELAGHSAAPKGHPWLKTGAVSLGALAIVLALRLPIAEPAPAPPFEPNRTGALGKLPGQSAGARQEDHARGSTDGPVRSRGGADIPATDGLERGDLAREPH